MLGIIGGNGVAATNRLCQLIEEKYTMSGAYRDCHHPEMIVWQATKVPSRSMYLEGRGPSWIEDYIRIGKLLKQCGCTELCMCCNTAHYAIKDLSREIGVPFVNLLDLVALRCKALGVRKVGLMCTDGLRNVGLYEERFSSIVPEIELIYPEKKYQDFVTKGICGSKHSVRFKSNDVAGHPYNYFSAVSKHLIEGKGVDCIVAGCTDISNVYNQDNFGGIVEFVDSLDVLVDYIVNKYELEIK